MEQRPVTASHHSHSPLPLPPSPPLSPLPLSPFSMPTLRSSSFEPSPFTLPTPTLPPSASAAFPSAAASRSARGKRELSDAAEVAEDGGRKKRRQEQNRRAAATSRVNNKLKRNRLEQRVTELEEANDRLKRLRHSLAEDNTTLTSSASSSSLSSSSSVTSASPSLPLIPPHNVGTFHPSTSASSRVRRSSDRESAVLVSPLPWDCLHLIRNKPNIQRAITTIIALSTLLLLCTLTLLALLSLTSVQTTSTFRSPLPLGRAPIHSSLSTVQPLLLSSLLWLSASPLLHSSPSPTFPTLPAASRSSPLLTPPPPQRMLRVSSQRRRLTVSRDSSAFATGTAATDITAVLSVEPGRAGISAAALAGVQLRAGRSVAERVWTRGGVRFQPQLRGTNASVIVNERVGSPPWLLAVLMMTAMVS